MTTLQAVFALFGALGLGGGATAWFYVRPMIRKHRAEAHKTDVEAAASESAAEDEHLKTVVGFVVEPLKDRLGELEAEVAQLRVEVTSARRKYFRLIDWARDVLAWKRVWHPDAQPPMPTLPPEISDDL